LKATQLLDETAVRKWLQDKNVTLTYFGKGEDALEALYLNKKNSTILGLQPFYFA